MESRISRASPSATIGFEPLREMHRYSPPLSANFRAFGVSPSGVGQRYSGVSRGQSSHLYDYDRSPGAGGGARTRMT